MLSMRKGPPMAPGRSGQRPDSECCEPEVAAVCSNELRGGTVMVDSQEGGGTGGRGAGHDSGGKEFSSCEHRLAQTRLAVAAAR